MRRALFGGMALACSAGPLGVFLILRHMSLIGDAIAHGILPGTALAFWLFGLSLPALTLGGLAAGLGMAGLAAWVSRRTGLREDASLAALYPISLASGVLLLGLAGRKLDLLHLLFGSALAVDTTTLKGMLGTALLSLTLLLLIYRALSLDSLDPLFLRSVSRLGPLAHGVFLTLVVLNLVIGFQAIGALMVVGLMMLPAAATRFHQAVIPGHRSGSGAPIKPVATRRRTRPASYAFPAQASPSRARLAASEFGARHGSYHYARNQC